jgi:glycosyltransferase involved in cell wall biosynthesis
MEEVAGGAAELVDPREVESIAAGIERALARRDELRAAGLVRAQAFTWESSADATVQAYRKAVAGPSRSSLSMPTSSVAVARVRRRTS